MRLLRTAFLVCLASALLVSTGCAYRYRFNTGAPQSDRVVEEWRHIYMWGWVSGPPFDLEAACPEGVAQFGSYIGWLNWLPGFFTLGIYAPRTVYAVCAAQPDAPEALE